MLIQSENAGFNNKGAQLMLTAIKQHVEGTYPEGRVGMRLRSYSYRQRRQNGIVTIGSFDSKRAPALLGRFVALATALLPRPLRRALQVESALRVDAVFNAAGLAYSDQRPPGLAENLARRAKKWKADGKKVVLLPQTFGPFEKPRVARAMRQILERADLVFARDRLSYGYLTAFDAAEGCVQQSPDMTIPLKGADLPRQVLPERTAVIVPNERMTEKTDPEVARQYMDLMARCLEKLQRAGFEVAIVLHALGAKDAKLARQLQRGASGKPRVIREEDPLKLKAVLGQATVVVSSRYHGLVNALSQGVPALATSWSHKYETLLEDFDCPGMLASPTDADAALETLDRLIDEEARATLKKKIAAAAAMQKERVARMWEQVDRVVLGESYARGEGRALGEGRAAQSAR